MRIFFRKHKLFMCIFMNPDYYRKKKQKKVVRFVWNDSGNKKYCMLSMFYTIATYCHFNIKQMISFFCSFCDTIYKDFFLLKQVHLIFLLTILIMIYNNKNEKSKSQIVVINYKTLSLWYSKTKKKNQIPLLWKVY